MMKIIFHVTRNICFIGSHWTQMFPVTNNNMYLIIWTQISINFSNKITNLCFLFRLSIFSQKIFTFFINSFLNHFFIESIQYFFFFFFKNFKKNGKQQGRSWRKHATMNFYFFFFPYYCWDGVPSCSFRYNQQRNELIIIIKP